jgi:hypothetical protein
MCCNGAGVNVNIHSKGKSLTPIEIAIASIYLPILINNKAALTSSSKSDTSFVRRLRTLVKISVFAYIVDRSTQEVQRYLSDIAIVAQKLVADISLGESVSLILIWVGFEEWLVLMTRQITCIEDAALNSLEDASPAGICLELQ